VKPLDALKALAYILSAALGLVRGLAEVPRPAPAPASAASAPACACTSCECPSCACHGR
jgi:hypothetical protein